MENFISLVHKLDRVCTAVSDHGQLRALPTGWDALPSMVVVGSQGSGKSSVVERIVGKEFIPRGSGSAITTRCPLVVQLIQIPGTVESAQFSHCPNRSFTDFGEVRKEIAAETNRRVGNSKQISPVPIHLTISSPKVVNLTLVDLPSIPKVDVEGQLDIIVQDVQDIVQSFIEQTNSIILAVCAANENITTSPAIKICQEVDPEGRRTFGVLTKVDVMDERSTTVNILEGRACQLHFSWTGVVNRSQEESMISARFRECEYFASTEEYKHLTHRMGTENLVRILCKFMEDTVKAKIDVKYLLAECSSNTEVTKKNKLQAYALRAYGDFPSYQLSFKVEGHHMSFRCTVQVHGKSFTSVSSHPNRKDAEEDAASVACSELMGDETLETLLDLFKKDRICKISLLKEYALKKKIPDPLFCSSRVADRRNNTLWLSTVTVGSHIYFGSAARTKRSSAQSASCEAAVHLLEDGDEVIIKILRARWLKVLSEKESLSDEDNNGHLQKKRKRIEADLLSQ